MPNERYPLGVPIPTANQIMDNINTGISPGATKLLEPGMVAGVYLKTLIQAQLFNDAIRFVAYALPNRYAVWWGVRCLETVSDALKPNEIEALDATRSWAIHPSEISRLAVDRKSGGAKLNSAASCLARAAAFVGVKLPNPKYGKPHNFPAKGVHAAIMLSTVNADDPDELCRDYLVRGFQISQGGDPIPEQD